MGSLLVVRSQNEREVERYVDGVKPQTVRIRERKGAIDSIGELCRVVSLIDPHFDSEENQDRNEETKGCDVRCCERIQCRCKSELYCKSEVQ